MNNVNYYFKFTVKFQFLKLSSTHFGLVTNLLFKLCFSNEKKNGFILFDDNDYKFRPVQLKFNPVGLKYS